MRDSLKQLISDTIIFEYSLPNKDKDIKNVHFSTTTDECYSISNNEDLVKIIYNSILEYSYDEFDFGLESYNNMLYSALKTKLRFNENSDDETKIRYGFYGEVLLHCILHKLYKTNCLISRGYFYNPLENSETKGYDAYHIIKNNSTEELELWFGEVKFRIDQNDSIRSVMQNITNAISNEYLGKNILAMVNHKDKLKNDDDRIKTIINKWELNPEINIITELKNNNMILVYPVYIVYDKLQKDYDACIKSAISYIEENYTDIQFNIDLKYKIFFIFMPIDGVMNVKKEVLEWIKQKKPVMS